MHKQLLITFNLFYYRTRTHIYTNTYKSFLNTPHSTGVGALLPKGDVKSIKAMMLHLYESVNTNTSKDTCIHSFALPSL